MTDQLTQIWDWIVFNKVAVAIIIVAVCLLLYYFYVKRKNDDLAEEAAQQNSEQSTNPEPEIPNTSMSLDSLYMNGYHPANMTEVTNIDRLKKMLDLVNKDLKENVETYEKAKSQHKELVEIDVQLRKNIKMLSDQKMIYEGQLSQLGALQEEVKDLPPLSPKKKDFRWWKNAPIDPKTGKHIMPESMRRKMRR